MSTWVFIDSSFLLFKWLVSTVHVRKYKQDFRTPELTFSEFKNEDKLKRIYNSLNLNLRNTLQRIIWYW